MAVNGVVAYVEFSTGEEFDITLFESTVEGWLIRWWFGEPCETGGFVGPEGGGVGDGFGMEGLVGGEGSVGGYGVVDYGLGVIVVFGFKDAGTGGGGTAIGLECCTCWSGGSECLCCQ